MPFIYFNITVTVLVAIHLTLVLGSSVLDRISLSSDTTHTILSNLFLRWEVDEFPNFLSSGYMSIRSWNYLKNKLEEKMISAALSTGPKSFTIVFTGSSVTSGQDSEFQQSFPVLVERIMKPAFINLNINLIVRNVAIGNNPCLPYDACVRTFAGDDADIVVWEQSYNCLFNQDLQMQEQFVRQSQFMPSKPIIVFSSSDTPNWSAEQCLSDKKPYSMSINDRDLVLKLNSSRNSIEQIITGENQAILTKWGRNIQKLIAQYSNVAIELFRHDQYSVYQCYGPYVKSWSSGNAGWHPSVLGHELRAAHYSFVWLYAWKRSLESLRWRIQQIVSPKTNIVSMPLLEKLSQETMISMQEYLGAKLPARIWSSNIPDNAKCYTSFIPRTKEAMSLSALIVGGLEASDAGPDKPGWRYVIFESLLDPGYLVEAERKGYLDRKHALYGNDLSGELTLSIKLHQRGRIFLCEPPGVWGEYPKGFGHLWNQNDVYFKILSKDKHFFPFKSRAAAEDFVVAHEHESTCVTSKRHYDKGSYILSVLPRGENNIFLSTVIFS